MFEAIRGAFHRWRNPPVRLIIGPGIVPDNDDLARRVFQRLRAVQDDPPPDNPLQLLCAVAADEVMIDVNLAAARERVAVLELMHKLPTRQRALLLDHVERGLTYKQLAKKHGLTNKIVLRDLSKAYATIRMQSRSDDERATTVDNVEPVRAAAGQPDAGVRTAAPVMGGSATVHHSGTPHGGVSVLRADQRPDESCLEGGRPEHPAS